MTTFLKAAEAIPSNLNLPVTTLLIREKLAVTLFEGPFIQENESHTTSTYSMNAVPFPVTASLKIPPIYSNDGEFVCVLPERERPAVYRTDNLSRIVELDVTDAVKAEFSSLGRFLVTWSMVSKSAGGSEVSTGNLKVWSVISGSLVAHYSQKTYRADLIQWTPDDSLCFRQVSNEIHVYNSSSSLCPDATVAKIHHQGFTQFKIAKIENEETINIAVFNPEAGGKPARVTLFSLNLSSFFVNGPVNSRTIFGATESDLLWNKSGLILLAHSQSDIDSSNTSYYGAMGLYLIHSKSDLSIKVEQTKQGPVHAVQWSPTGDRFVIAAGNMPCQSTLYNEKGEPVFQFGAAHRNVVSWSPNGRFLCLAGFGNLAGEMDFYDTLKLKKMGSNVSHCATSHSWSPDSRYFMTASLAPRMNVDNCFKLFKYNGIGPIVQHNFEKAYDAIWKPVAPLVYPNRGPSPPKRGSEGEPTIVSAPQTALAPNPAPYRPPHSTGSLATFMKGTAASDAPVGKVKKDAPTEKFVPPSQKQRVIPGMPPQQSKQKSIPGLPPQVNQAKSKPAASSPSTGPSNNSLKPAAAEAKPISSTSSVVTPTSTPAVSPATAKSFPTSAETAESKEKKVKAIQKKLKQIQEIKDKVAAGLPVEPEQLKKIETEATLQLELASLR